jgi:hypothetical protein
VVRRASPFHLHFTPTSASWLNLVERWFALITGQAIRRGSFDNVARLEKAIMAWLQQWNANAQPFRWTKPATRIRRSINNAAHLFTRRNTSCLQEGDACGSEYSLRSCGDRKQLGELLSSATSIGARLLNSGAQLQPHPVATVPAVTGAHEEDPAIFERALNRIQIGCAQRRIKVSDRDADYKGNADFTCDHLCCRCPFWLQRSSLSLLQASCSISWARLTLSAGQRDRRQDYAKAA